MEINNTIKAFDDLVVGDKIYQFQFIGDRCVMNEREIIKVRKLFNWDTPYIDVIVNNKNGNGGECITLRKIDHITIRGMEVWSTSKEPYDAILNFAFNQGRENVQKSIKDALGIKSRRF